MSLASNVTDLATRIATEFKAVRTLISGTGTGDISGLTTTAKTSLVAAINEVKASATGAPPAATETTAGVAELATQAETTTGTDDARIVTPLKLAQKLTAWAQPLSTNLTALAAVVSGAFGRTMLATATPAAGRTALQLATVAQTGKADDLTGTLPTSVLPPLAISEVFTVATQAAMLALTAERGDVAIRTDTNRSYILSSDSPGTLADWKLLTAGGDVLSVNGKTGVVTVTATDVGLGNVDNTTDALKPISTATADALALKAPIASPTFTGTVSGITKAMVGLGSVDNTTDLAKPVSTATTTQLNLKLTKSLNLSDLANAATSRTNLDVWSRAEVGPVTTDFVAAFNSALL